VSSARAAASNQQGHPCGYAHRAGKVQPLGPPERIGRQQSHRGRQQPQAHRHVDEDQAPSGLGQEASQHCARREARGGDRGVEAQGSAAFLLAGPTGNQQGQARWSQHRRPGALHYPGRDEHAWLDGKTSGDASHDEYHQASPEQPGPAGRVGETAGEQ